MTYTVGTSYFVSFQSAKKYYAQYGFTGQDVLRKLVTNEISIGKPAPDAVLDKDGRYYIQGEVA